MEIKLNVIETFSLLFIIYSFFPYFFFFISFSKPFYSFYCLVLNTWNYIKYSLSFDSLSESFSLLNPAPPSPHAPETASAQKPSRQQVA